MPLHPVPIIIGTTLALVGGGMAFKKVCLMTFPSLPSHANAQFVYDPHLAPYIEAFIALHTPSRQVESRRAVPVSVETSSPAYARSTARRDRGVELRRRRVSNDPDDSRQPLLSPAHGGPDTAGRVDTYEPYFPDPMSTAQHQPQAPLRRFSRDRPSFLDLNTHLDRPSSPQDAEVREVIFNQPPTPLRPSSTPAAAMSVNVFHPYGAAIPDIMTSPPKVHHPLQSSLLEAPSPRTQPESTAFSFLSLSQASSPEVPHAMLGSMSGSTSLGNALDQWAAVPRSAERRDTLRLERDAREVEHPLEDDALSAIDNWADVRSSPEVRRGAREEDVMSLPETSTSGYEDAESYSPEAVRGPMRIHSTFLHASPARSAAGLGLDSGRAVEAHADQGRSQLPRARDSVISLSESEGWTGMSDFDGSHI